jgi:phage shock protein PspC (stress-responsive transcriptional regulator)
MARPLTRDPKGAMICGVASGFADYFDVDPVIARLGFILLTFVHGVGVLFYIICCFIMPKKDELEGTQPPASEKVVEEVRLAGEKVTEGVKRAAARDTGRGHIIVGVILIVMGLLFLLDRFSWMFYWPTWLSFHSLWPLILVAIGTAMIFRSGGGGRKGGGDRDE